LSGLRDELRNDELSSFDVEECQVHGLPFEGRSSYKKHVEDTAQGPDIRGEGVGVLVHNFRRDVIRSSTHGLALFKV
jgi:hypothetical protein